MTITAAPATGILIADEKNGRSEKIKDSWTEMNGLCQNGSALSPSVSHTRGPHFLYSRKLSGLPLAII